MREDRYFIAGRAIAVSLVHGGPPAGFLSPTLFSSLVDGPELAKPVLEDIADSDLHEKIKRVICFLSFTICCGLCVCFYTRNLKCLFITTTGRSMSVNHFKNC